MERDPRASRRRLYDVDRAQWVSQYPPGLRALGQRWASRPFRLDTAEVELFDLVATIPGLRENAVALTRIWLQQGVITSSDQTRLEDTILGRRRTTDADSAATDAIEEASGSRPGTAPLAGEDASEGTSRSDRVGAPQQGRGGPLQPGQVLGERYEIVELVGDGSMGAVYKARDRRSRSDSSGEFVALKVLPEKLLNYGPAIRALQREAHAGVLLAHPKIVKTYGLERDGQTFFIVMEWVPGGSLADWMAEHPDETLPPERVGRILARLGSALSYAHGIGFVHADIKPGNVMLLEDDDVRLCDFGVARYEGSMTATLGPFDPSVLRAATPSYASPQVLHGEKPTVRDDVYSLACVAYRLLAGRRPFETRDAREALRLGREPQRIAGLNDRQWGALQRALSLTTEERQETVAGFVAEFLGLDAFESGPPGRLRAATVPESPEPRSVEKQAPLDTGRHRRSRFWLVVLILIVLGGISWYLSPRFELAEKVADLFGESVEHPGDTAGQAAPERVKPPPAESGIPDETATREEAVTAAKPVTGDASPAPASEPSAAERPPGRARVTILLSQTERRPDLVELRATENEGSVLIRLERATATPTAVTLQIVPISREDGFEPLAEMGEFTAEPGVIVPAGQSVHDLVLPIRDDDALTGTRRFGFHLEQTEPVSRTVARVEIILTDDEWVDRSDYLPPGTVAFATGAKTIDEAGAALQARVLRFGPVGSERTTRVAVIEAGAEEGADFVAPAEATVRFEPGQDNVTLFIPIIDDAVPEPSEGFRLIFDDPTGPVGAPSQLEVSIIDNDL